MIFPRWNDQKEPVAEPHSRFLLNKMRARNFHTMRQAFQLNRALALKNSCPFPWFSCPLFVFASDLYNILFHLLPHSEP